MAKKRFTYEEWTKQESDILLELMVNAVSRGWTDNNGNFSKQIVEKRILPVLNSELGCQKNFNNYQSRLRWFKNRWLLFSTLLQFNSDFGFDSMTKRFIAPDKVWDDYLKAHPKNGTLRYGVFDDYKDLKIIFGNDGATGRNSKRLDNNAVVGILEAGEGRRAHTEDLNYDLKNEIYAEPPQDELLAHSMTPHIFPNNVEISKKRTQGKRDRTEYENNPQSDILKQLTKITTTVAEVYSILKKTETERTYTSWDAIKEVPNVDENLRLDAFDLLDSKTKKDGFLRMTLEERRNWIFHTIQK